MKYGIDISHWQGNIDFTKVNADFVIMKLSQAEYKDPNFEEYYRNYYGAKGCYIYNKVKTVEQAEKEAKYAVKCLNGRIMELGVWLDLEDATMKHLGKGVLKKIIDTEASIIKEAGYNVGIYSNKDWYNNVLDSKALCKTYPFWIARYPYADNGTVKESLSPKSFDGCVMWQYSSKGKVPGIKGNVDMDLMYDNFGFNSSNPAPAAKEEYEVGKTYTTNNNLYVRNDANGEKLKYDALTVDAKKNATYDNYGCAILRSGTKVTCKEVKKLATSTWIRIPSGWICAKNISNTYIK